MKYDYDNFAFKIPFGRRVLKTACDDSFVNATRAPDYATLLRRKMENGRVETLGNKNQWRA